MNYILLAIVSASVGYWIGRISRSNEKPQLLPTPRCKVDGCGEPGGYGRRILSGSLVV